MDDDNDLKRFHHALYQKKSTLTDVTATEGGPIVGKLLDFTVPFPLIRDVMRLEETKTFVRNDYEKLWMNIQRTSFRKCVITGKPGIGKSRFLLYVLRQLIHEGITDQVLYSHSSGFAFLFTKNEIKEFRNPIYWKDLNVFLDDRNSWWLMDGKEHGPDSRCRGRIILATTDEVDYHQLIKQATLFWMPEWDQADQGKREEDKKYLEIRALREHVYSSVTEEDMLKAASYWGPVPRKVLETINTRGRTDASRYDLYELDSQIGKCLLTDMELSIRVQSGLSMMF